MGIDALLEEIRDRAREEEAEIRRDADAGAEGIIERARSEAEEERARALEEAERELRAELRGERARVEHEVRRQVMEARAELLGRVRERALELAGEATATGAYRRGLPERIREARSCLPEDAGVVVRCPAALEEPIREALGGSDDVRVEVDAAVGAGFRATTPGGDLTADATLARRLERDWPELTVGVLEQLEERWAETGDR